MQLTSVHTFATLFALLITFANETSAFDVLGMGANLGSLSFNFAKDQTFCRWAECCIDSYIPGDIKGLERKLRNKLFGQHIVVEHLIAALEAHFHATDKSKKPLVISFHGTPGTGKNYVADMIAETLYKNGLKSKFVHKYLGRADFSVDELTNWYKQKIAMDVKDGIARCPRSLFIFDEVDKMPQGLFEPLASLLDYNAEIKGEDYTKAIFIFLTNTAGVQISNRLGQLMKEGNLREDTKLSDFEQILQTAAYNLEGGMMKTSLIESHVIDHYLPFLPLEKAHVIKCLEEEYYRWDVNPNPTAIDIIVKESISYDPNYRLFAQSGCKTLEKKVAVEIMVARRKRQSEL